MLKPYGKILDICIFVSSHHHFFMGQGCTCLDVTDSDQVHSAHSLKYPGLDHQVRAFWKGSPPYCKICQGDTHEREFCPKAKLQNFQVCSLCGVYGHSHTSCSRSELLQADCCIQHTLPNMITLHPPISKEISPLEMISLPSPYIGPNTVPNNNGTSSVDTQTNN